MGETESAWAARGGSAPTIRPNDARKKADVVFMDTILLAGIATPSAAAKYCKRPGVPLLGSAIAVTATLTGSSAAPLRLSSLLFRLAKTNFYTPETAQSPQRYNGSQITLIAYFLLLLNKPSAILMVFSSSGA